MDEVFISNNSYDLQCLLLKLDEVKIDINMTISPISTCCDRPYKLLYQSSPHTIIERLIFKHRNTKQISLLLIHLKWFMNQKETLKSKAITDEDDVSLEQSCLAEGPVPIWIKAGDGFDDEKVLNHVLTMLQGDRNVVLLFNNYDLTKTRKHDIEVWCKAKKWECIDRIAMTGSEASVVILYDIGQANLEDFSRAIKKLIIITR